jgi:hypothetical protein
MRDKQTKKTAPIRSPSWSQVGPRADVAIWRVDRKFCIAIFLNAGSAPCWLHVSARSRVHNCCNSSEPDRVRIGRPSCVRRISGSLPRLPIRITLFTEPAIRPSARLRQNGIAYSRSSPGGCTRISPGATATVRSGVCITPPLTPENLAFFQGIPPIADETRGVETQGLTPEGRKKEASVCITRIARGFA